MTIQFTADMIADIKRRYGPHKTGESMHKLATEYGCKLGEINRLLKGRRRLRNVQSVEDRMLTRYFIINLIRENPGCSVYFIRENTRDTKERIKKHIERLKIDLMIETLGYGPLREYYPFGEVMTKSDRDEIIDNMPLRRNTRPVTQSDFAGLKRMPNPFAQMICNTLGVSL